ncbi:MAG: S26 family signal peptidase [Planctomycetota bacterium]|nr:S26 family signal peptidase [Planctomycetota bacterium]
MRRRLTVILLAGIAVTVGLALAPRRYEVEGISMGPGLLPGDLVSTGWLPERDRWRTPERFDRWIVTLPDGSAGIKRLTGVPGETVSLAAGDLAIDGELVLKSPAVLASIGSVVSGEAAPAKTAWSREPELVLDRAPFATEMVNLRLLPVRDIGFAAIIDVADGQPGRLRVRGTVGSLSITWRLSGGRCCLVAGRLDGHEVAVAWPLPAGATLLADDSRCLPPGAPGRWSVARPWPAGDGDDDAPAMSLDLLPGGEVRGGIERVIVWRDSRYRPAADGTTRWQLGQDAFFLLGDFSAGSRDSRQFGPLPRSALRHRLSQP